MTTTNLTQQLARNIANRRREPNIFERIFAHLNSAADGVGVVRIALTKTAVRAADGVGYLRKASASVLLALGLGVSSKSAEMAQAARKSVEAASEERKERAKEAPVAVPKDVRRRWEKELKKMGKFEVNYHLDRTANLPSTAAFTFVDTGILNGATRHPTRAFAFEWAADAPEDDGGEWRPIVIGVTFLMVAAGALLVSFM